MKETNGEENTGGDEGDKGHMAVGAAAEHQVVNRKCLPPRRRGQAGGKEVRRNIGGGQAAAGPSQGTAGQQWTKEMTRIKLTNTRVKEAIGKRREGGVIANDSSLENL